MQVCSSDDIERLDEDLAAANRLITLNRIMNGMSPYRDEDYTFTNPRDWEQFDSRSLALEALIEEKTTREIEAKLKELHALKEKVAAKKNAK